MLSSLFSCARNIIDHVIGPDESQIAAVEIPTPTIATPSGIFTSLQGRITEAAQSHLIDPAVESVKTIAFKKFLKETVIFSLELFFKNAEGSNTPRLNPCQIKLEELKAELANTETTFSLLKTKSEALLETLQKAFSEGVIMPENKTFSSASPRPIPEEKPAEPIVCEKSRETFVAEIHQQLDQLRLNLVRKTQLSILFGEQIPDSLKDFPTHKNYSREVLRQISIKAQKNSGSILVRPFLEIYDRIVFTLIGFFTNYYCGQATESLKYHLAQLKEENDDSNKQAVLDAIYRMLFDGLHLYTSEIINATKKIDAEAKIGKSLDGTPDDMIQKILKDKIGLRGNEETEEQFYQACFNHVLDKIFVKPTGYFALLKKIQQMFDKMVIKTLVKMTGCLKDPFKFVSDSTKVQKDIAFKIDKTIISIIEPLVMQLKSEDDNGPVERSDFSAKNYFYAQGTKQKLQQGLKALFRASSILGSSDLGILQRQADELSKKPPFFSIDNALFEVAEAAAVSILDALDTTVSHKNYFFAQSSSLLKLINDAFIDSEDTPYKLRRDLALAQAALKKISNTDDPAYAIALEAKKAADKKVKILDEEIEAANKKRADLIQELAKITIQKSIQTIPILNPELSFKRMNQKIAKVKAFAEEFSSSLSLDELKSKISVFKTALRNDLQLNPDQIEQINKALSHLKESIKSHDEATNKAQQEAVKQQMSDYLKETTTSVYEPKCLISVLNVAPLKMLASVTIGIAVKQELHKLYQFFTHPLTLKYFISHQATAQLLKI